jgi:hypothetical protein
MQEGGFDTNHHFAVLTFAMGTMVLSICIFKHQA